MVVNHDNMLHSGDYHVALSEGLGEHFVTMGAAEWLLVMTTCFILVIIMFYIPRWISFHNGSSWMFFHQCGFFHKSSKFLMWSTSYHILNSWIFFLFGTDSFIAIQCLGLINFLSRFGQLKGFLSVRILFLSLQITWLLTLCRHTLNSWMVFS